MIAVNSWNRQLGYFSSIALFLIVIWAAAWLGFVLSGVLVLQNPSEGSRIWIGQRFRRISLWSMSVLVLFLSLMEFTLHSTPCSGSENANYCLESQRRTIVSSMLLWLYYCEIKRVRKTMWSYTTLLLGVWGGEYSHVILSPISDWKFFILFTANLIYNSRLQLMIDLVSD